MINLPFSDSSTAEDIAQPLEAGTHVVGIRAMKLVQTKAGEDKLVVEYADLDGMEFVDWLGFRSPAQAKRTYAYICRLHELAGLPVPKGGGFDEAALINAGNLVKIEIQPNDKGYMNLVGFPEAGTVGEATDEVPF